MCEIDGYELVLDPTGVPAEVVRAPGADLRVDGDLRGKRIGIVDNRMTGMRPLAEAIERELADRFGVAGVSHWVITHSTAPDPEVLADIAGTVDAAILGLGNCGACTTWECGVSARLRRSVPTLDVVTEPFEPVARAGFNAHGLPEQPLAVLPANAHEASPLAVERMAAEVAEACAATLTTAGARP